MTRLVAILACLPLLSGCETLAYYLQAADGQLRLLARARPVEDLIGDPATPQALRETLQTAAEIRAFASSTLELPDNGSYRRYAELGRPYPVWNVVAAPELSLRALQSCFPVAGCVPYRGYFSEEAARRHAAQLRNAGSDVLVYGVPAYSTLGWFDDPLLSSFIRYPDAELARLIFHELAHQRVYAAGDAVFNESFAVVVEREGVRRWLVRSGRSEKLAGFEAVLARADQFRALIRDTRAELEKLYASSRPRAETLAQKRAVFARLHQRYAGLKAAWGGYAGYDRFFVDEPGNALLVSFETYSGLVAGFERLLAAEGGDLERFYRRSALLAARPYAERRSFLEGYLPGPR